VIYISWVLFLWINPETMYFSFGISVASRPSFVQLHERVLEMLVAPTSIQVQLVKMHLVLVAITTTATLFRIICHCCVHARRIRLLHKLWQFHCHWPIFLGFHGRTIVVHDHIRGRVSCGIIQAPSVATADMSSYPSYSDALRFTGFVSVDKSGDHILLSWHLCGFEAELCGSPPERCRKCLWHPHQFRFNL